jgi:hypothetical protein
LSLSALEELLVSLVSQWAALKAYEERLAAEEAEMFKTKARSTVILGEDVSEGAGVSDTTVAAMPVYLTLF